VIGDRSPILLRDDHDEVPLVRLAAPVTVPFAGGTPADGILPP